MDCNEEKDLINRIKKLLIEDYIISIPTDTVYGLLANMGSDVAIDRLYSIKGRQKSKQFAQFVSHDNINNYALLSERDRLLIKCFSPGPITYILKNKQDSNKTLAIRIPDNQFLLNLINSCEFGIAATSANISGEKDVSLYENVPNLIKNHQYVKNFSLLQHGKVKNPASSIFDLTDNEKIIEIRAGLINLNDLFECLNSKLTHKLI